MKILFVACDYLPGSTRIATKMRPELVHEFITRGHEVIVVTPDPELRDRYVNTKLDGADIWKFKSGPIQDVSKIKRAINETLLSHNAWKALKQMFRQNPQDLIIYNSPSIFWGTLVRRLKKLWKVPSYLILRDIFPQWVVDNGILSKHSPITYYFRFFEWLNYNAADRIALQSVKGREWFYNNRVNNKPLDVVYNWAADNPEIATEKIWRKKLGLEEKVVYFYGGNIGHAQDMMNVVRLAKNMIPNDNAHFLLIGKGDEVLLIKDAIQREKLTNLTYLEPVSQDVFRKMQAEFDIGLFSLHHDHTTHNFPGKLLGYMVQEMPILGSINPDNDLKSMVDEAEAGFVTINGDNDVFLANALKLLNDKELRLRMGKGAKRLLYQVFSVKAAADTILESFDKEVL